MLNLICSQAGSDRAASVGSSCFVTKYHFSNLGESFSKINKLRQLRNLADSAQICDEILIATEANKGLSRQQYLLIRYLSVSLTTID